MLHRALDVIFQHGLRLIAAVVVVPLAVGAFGFALDHSVTVEARVWADRPLFTPTFATDRFDSSDSPADIEAGILRELIGTSGFAAEVLTSVDPGYPSWSAEHQLSAEGDLQRNTTVVTEGSHLFTVSYRTPDAGRGRAVVSAVISAFGREVQAIDTNQVSVTQAALQAQVDSARQEMDDAVRQAQNYVASHRSVANDPDYQVLVGQAQSKTDRYLGLQAQIDEIKGSQTAVSVLQASFFHVVDQPFAVPFKLDQHAPAVRYGLYALIAIVSAEALFVYVIVRRDPRIRSVQDVRRAGRFKPLGSAPVPRRTR
ncbi:MAG TPA: hypothetical protein VLW53_02455 [Candidatus Eisenbacteria bacterium]|nr:hypothetical protein [Candidatus Eisenbacteria bacterium]